MKIKGHYYNWQVAAPLLMSILVFHKPLPQVWTVGGVAGNPPTFLHWVEADVCVMSLLV